MSIAASPRMARRVQRVPRSTYRLQFTGAFGFRDATALIPYLDRLGISDLYSSPMLKARPGSTSGYDVVDPTRLNPELGSPSDFDDLAAELAARNMGLLLDIVPNHMSASLENPWWRDVLESGPASPFARFFDVRWEWGTGTPVETFDEPKIVLPMLTDLFWNCLERGDLAPAFERGGFCLRYHGLEFPLDPRSWNCLLNAVLTELERTCPPGHPAVEALRGVLRELAALPEPARPSTDLPEKKRAIREKLERLHRSHRQFSAALEAVLASYRGRPGVAESFRPLEELIERQPYRLSFWRAGLERLNYRRFFDISDLVGLRVEDAEVFEASHSLLRSLYREGKVTGVRIDHIDGLRFPLEYLERLSNTLAAGEEGEARPPYLLVEKILMDGEELPGEWPVSGTTGYEFLGAVNRVFVDPEGEGRLRDLYTATTGLGAPFGEVAREKKHQVLRHLFTSEVKSLSGKLEELAFRDRRGRDLPVGELERALREVTVSLPVYRTYIAEGSVCSGSRSKIEQALEEATRRRPDVSPLAIGFLRSVLLPDSGLPPEELQARLDFVLSWQQFTGAVMAKGLEDTALYAHTSFISLNDVGSQPPAGRSSSQEFQRWLARRQAGWPDAMNATSTHDTKRSEDVRARIDVLSEVPHHWALSARRWAVRNSVFKPEANGSPVPGPSEELLLYQTLLGAWPPAGEQDGFVQRVKDYMLKAVREGKTFTDWLSPRTAYEEALLSFIDSILDPAGNPLFLEDFLRLQRLVAHYGALNSLGQVVLKVAAPGVPDFYQGNEVWDFSLVDPDNRRPVDYAKRRDWLEELDRREEETGGAALARDLAGRLDDGRVKLFVTSRALRARRGHPELFSSGETIPLEVEGDRAPHICAFARSCGSAWAVAAVPRLTTRLVRPGELPLGREVWGNTSMLLPPSAPDRWCQVFLGGEEVRCGGGARLPLWRTFGAFPVALLIAA